MSDSFSKVSSAISESVSTLVDNRLNILKLGLKESIDKLSKRVEVIEGGNKTFHTERQTLQQKVDRLTESFSTIQELDEKLSKKNDEILTLSSHVNNLEHEVTLMTDHELSDIENIKTDVDRLTDRLNQTENNAKEIREKLEKVTVSLARHTELRRSMRGI